MYKDHQQQRGQPEETSSVPLKTTINQVDSTYDSSVAVETHTSPRIFCRRAGGQKEREKQAGAQI